MDHRDHRDHREDDVEILVHISAPCTSEDDARYRSLASSYLNFMPARVAKLDIDDNGDEVPPEEAAASELGSIHVAFTPDAGFSQSFDHGSFVHTSPKRHVLLLEPGDSICNNEVPSSQPLSSQDIIEEVPDSYPACSVAVDIFCSPTRILEHYLQQIKPAARSVKRPLDETVEECHNEPDNTAPRPGKVAKFHKPEEDRRPPTTPLRRHQSDQGAFRPKVPQPTRSMSESLLMLDEPPATVRDIHPDALDIFPPEPPISEATMTVASLLTPRLENLARHLDLNKRYRPDSLVDLSHRPFERGYWLLDCSSWDVESRWQAWIFLAHWIRSGSAGWGVWCRRDESLDWIRTYCWGKIAGHMYLLLYLASVRRLKYMDIYWIGDDGEPKIVVAARGRRNINEGMSSG